MKISTKILLASAASGFALAGLAGPAMAADAAPAPAPATVSAHHLGERADQSQNFAYAVIIHFTNKTDQSIFIGPYQTEVKPGETREIANGSTFGVDINSSFTYGSKDAHKYQVRAKNPSLGTPWIDIAGSGERSLSEGQGFNHDFDGHRLEVNRGGDSTAQNGYKHFNVSVNA